MAASTKQLGLTCYAMCSKPKINEKFLLGFPTMKNMAMSTILSFGTCNPPTLICMYALHNDTFYEQFEPKETKKRGLCE